MMKPGDLVAWHLTERTVAWIHMYKSIDDVEWSRRNAWCMLEVKDRQSIGT